MENKAESGRINSILVGGDFVVDHHIYEGRRHHYGDDVSPGVGVCRQHGGAALIEMLLKELLVEKPDKQAGATGAVWTVHKTVEGPKAVKAAATNDGKSKAAARDEDTSHHAYAFWRPHPRGGRGRQYWRVSDAMGFGATKATKPSCEWEKAHNLPEHPDIIVLSEGGMGYRDCKECWEDLDFAGARWIVLKTAAPIADRKLEDADLEHGDLWTKLTRDRLAEKLVVVVSAHELRKTSARISVGLSWEATVESLLRALGEGGPLAPLRRCRHLLVAFESEGVAWLDFGPRRGDSPRDIEHCRVKLVYDAGAIEGDDAQALEGGALGLMSCLAASVAWVLALHLAKPGDAKPDLADAALRGLSAMRDLREKGHGPSSNPGAGFPAQRVAEVIKNPAHWYSHASFRASAPFPDPSGKTSPKAAEAVVADPPWTLLAESQPKPYDPAYELGRLALLNGTIALASLPHLGVGGLFSVDRQEIESLRTLAQLFSRYRADARARAPLSIGVFGPPGAGKSFAVKQLAGNLLDKEWCVEFNLSQFAGPVDLIGALHQVRDRVLQGQLPVAFFDEFDARSHRWLQYLLAPMQDGKFQEGQITHTLGRCIFVFAGATSSTFATFGPPEREPGEPKGSPQLEEARQRFRLAKGPDFKSRLDAYLDVVGPNRRSLWRRGDDGEWIRDEDPSDVTFPIRRALMIRSKLGCSPDEKVDIDEGLVHALLHVDEYTHGARSLDKILQPLQVIRPRPLRRSFLPPREQLAMQTKAQRFLELCDEAPVALLATGLKKAEVEKLAPEIHETWRKRGEVEGWIEKELDADFADLPETCSKLTEDGKLGEFYQSSNCEAARRMPEILQLIGLQMVQDADWPEEEIEAIRQRLEYHLELLADAEHDRWMKWSLDEGWRLGPKKNVALRQHHCLVPFSRLADVEKNKDRATIRLYPRFAKLVQMKIEPIR